MSCNPGCTCKNNAKAQAALVRYALEGDRLLEDPEIQQQLAFMRAYDIPEFVGQSDAYLLKVLMRGVARRSGAA